MGMLFNSAGTLRIINLVNNTFKKSNLNRLTHNHPSLINDLQHLGSGSSGLYAKICTPLSIDDYDDAVSTNWQAFLNLMDTTNQSSSGATISSILGNEIAKALQGTSPYNSIKAIEFFAVPSSALQLAVYPPPFPTITAGHDKVMIITIQTAAIDSLLRSGRRKR